MMEVRRDFVGWSSTCVGKAATIAIRYSCVRHQGYLDNESPDRGENAVLNYKMQQYRLFKALSLAYMFLWNARYVGLRYSRPLQRMRIARSAGRRVVVRAF